MCPGRWADHTVASGHPWIGKAEGLVLDAGTRRALVVVDLDDSEQPSELCEVDLSGSWFSH